MLNTVRCALKGLNTMRGYEAEVSHSISIIFSACCHGYVAGKPLCFQEIN